MQPDFESFNKLNRELTESLSNQRNPAKWMRERLLRYVSEFEKGLKPDEEIGCSLVSFGHLVTFHISEIGFHGPDLVCFYGLNPDGREVQLVQHISQVSVLFTAMPRIGETARRIGFRKDGDD